MRVIRVGRGLQRFRGGLVFKARRLCVSLNSGFESNKEEGAFLSKECAHGDDVEHRRHGCQRRRLISHGIRSEAGSYLRHIDSCITQLKAQGPSRTCIESKEEEENQMQLQLPVYYLRGGAMDKLSLERRKPCLKVNVVSCETAMASGSGASRVSRVVLSAGGR